METGKSTNKPEYVEEHDCEDCGAKAKTEYYGIDNHGNERTIKHCSNPKCPSNRKQQHLGQFLHHDESAWPTFDQWLTLREGKKQSEKEKQDYNAFISGKSDKLVIKGATTGIKRGHQPHITGSGAHDSRPGRLRTRGNQSRKAIKDFE